ISVCPPLRRHLNLSQLGVLFEQSRAAFFCCLGKLMGVQVILGHVVEDAVQPIAVVAADQMASGDAEDVTKREVLHHHGFAALGLDRFFFSGVGASYGLPLLCHM